MTEFKGMYDIREMRPSDKNFILATFLKGLSCGDSWFSMIPKDIFTANYKGVAEALINNGLVSVACLKEEPDVILGYSIVSKDFQTVHWVYCKKVWRLRGIARALLPKHPSTVTHLTEVGKSLLSKINNPVFNPFKGA